MLNLALENIAPESQFASPKCDKNATTKQKHPQPPGPGDLLTIEFFWVFIGRSGGI